MREPDDSRFGGAGLFDSVLLLECLFGGGVTLRPILIGSFERFVAVGAGRQGERPLRGAGGFILGEGFRVAADGGVFGGARGGVVEPFAGGLVVVPRSVADEPVDGPTCFIGREFLADPFDPAAALGASDRALQAAGHDFKFRRGELGLGDPLGASFESRFGDGVGEAIDRPLGEFFPGFFIRDTCQMFAEGDERGGLARRDLGGADDAVNGLSRFLDAELAIKFEGELGVAGGNTSDQAVFDIVGGCAGEPAFIFVKPLDGGEWVFPG